VSLILGHGVFCVLTKNPEAVDWTQYWNPLIYVDNTVGDPKETIARSIVYDVGTWEAFLVERHRLKGTFLENLELFHFPFDTQVHVPSYTGWAIKTWNFTFVHIFANY